MSPANTFAARHATRPFAWGQWDCIQMAGLVRAELGLPNPAALARGTYDGPMSARRALAPWGGTVEGVLRTHGRPVNRVEDYDLGLVRGVGGLRAVALILDGRALALGRTGWTPRPLPDLSEIVRMCAVDGEA